jgi:hypothetical protein
MIGRAGAFDLVRSGAVEQHRVAAVGAHGVVHERLDVPCRTGGGSGPLVGPDQAEALGEPVVRPGQQVEGEHARPCLARRHVGSDARGRDWCEGLGRRRLDGTS